MKKIAFFVILLSFLLVGCGKKSLPEISPQEEMTIHMCLMKPDFSDECQKYLDPNNIDIYGAAVRRQCDIMPGMQLCDVYFDTQTSWIDNVFSLSVDDTMPLATSPVVVELNDGDAYTITISSVQKIIRGKALRMLAYNGSIPWPILKAPQWSTIQLTVINTVPDIETTVHHHGLRQDSRQDGVPTSMWWYDTPMQQWDTTTYTLTFPDSGVFWYHPHVREELQQELGLYGNYIVSDGSDIPVNSEYVLMLDDLFLDQNGSLLPFDTEKGNYVLMGRFWTTPLVNGETNYILSLKKWEVTRLYLTNVANVTPFNISIPWAQMKLVGGDIGLYEREEMVDNILIAPAERYIVDVYVPNDGKYMLVNKTPYGSVGLAQLSVDTESISTSYRDVFQKIHTNEAIVLDIDQYRDYFDDPVQKTLVLDVQMDGMWNMNMWAMHNKWQGVSIALPGWLDVMSTHIERYDQMPMMNSVSTTDNTRWNVVDKDSGEKNMDIHREFDQWDVVKIRIFNDGNSVHPMQHPFHFHGQRFLVLNKNGVKNNNLVWKDTVLVPTGEYVDILMDLSNPWTWMAHCHIAEHLTAGMMMHFTVNPL